MISLRWHSWPMSKPRTGKKLSWLMCQTAPSSEVAIVDQEIFRFCNCLKRATGKLSASMADHSCTKIPITLKSSSRMSNGRFCKQLLILYFCTFQIGFTSILLLLFCFQWIFSWWKMLFHVSSQHHLLHYWSLSGSSLCALTQNKSKTKTIPKLKENTLWIHSECSCFGIMITLSAS